LCNPLGAQPATLAAALACVEDAPDYADTAMMRLREVFRVTPLYHALLDWKDVSTAFGKYKSDIDNYGKLESLVQEAVREVISPAYAKRLQEILRVETEAAHLAAMHAREIAEAELRTAGANERRRRMKSGCNKRYRAKKKARVDRH
jgi:hypothetical protein